MARPSPKRYKPRTNLAIGFTLGLVQVLTPPSLPPHLERQLMQNHPYFSGSGIALFAHRGYSPPSENTFEAIKHAIDFGAEYIETDVRCTRDGHAVLFHDEDLKRLTGSEEKVSSLNLKEFKLLKFVQGGSPTTLIEALEQFPKMKFNLDIKDPLAVNPTVRAIESCSAHQRVLISSFSESTRQKAIALVSKPVATSASASLVLRVRLRAFFGFGISNLLNNVGALQVPASMYGIRFDTKRFIRQISKTGTLIHFWTINDEKSIRRLINRGANGIVTDNTELAGRILGKS
ncbi:MAG: hypothetical protein RL523_147 [Actinomycetota bacterium]|jgi:glycerophosphoryl diester phosphodiesterase